MQAPTVRGYTPGTSDAPARAVIARTYNMLLAKNPKVTRRAVARSLLSFFDPEKVRVEGLRDHSRGL